MKREKLIYLYFLLLLLSLATLIFFFKARSVDVEKHNRRMDLLLSLQEAESSLDRDAYRVISFLLVQYDPLVSQVNHLLQLEKQLVDGPESFRQSTTQEITELSDEYFNLLRKKISILEDIKSRSAVVRNGLHYMPIAGEDLIRASPGMHKMINGIMGRIYSYYIFPSNIKRDELEEDVKKLEQYRTRGFVTHELDIFITHLRASLDGTEELTDLQNRYVNVQTEVMFHRLHREYSEYYRKRFRRSEAFSYVLLFMALALMIAVGYSARLLYLAHRETRDAWIKLNDAVESLSEAFALFDNRGSLVIHNKQFEMFYPWLKEYLFQGVSLPFLKEKCREKSIFIMEEGDNPAPLFPCQPRTYEQHLKDGRWYKASDSCTSEGGIVSVRVDITRQKKRELEYRKLHQAVEQSPAAVIITDTNGIIQYVNPRFVEVTGYSFDEAVGQNPRILKSGDKSSEEYRELWENITSGKEWRGQFHNKKKDGTIFWESASISPIRNEEGRITHFVAVKEDITSRIRAEEELRMSAAVFDTISEGILVTDKYNHIKSVNPAFTEITGYTLEDVLGKNPSVLSSGRQGRDFYEKMWNELKKNGTWSGEIWNRKKDGVVFPEWMSLSVIRDDHGEVQEHVAVFSDITRRKSDEAKIRYQANYDALTGLPNRSLVLDRMNKALARARRENWLVALIFLDLDRFKSVNDTHGHVVGDELLKIAASRLQNELLESDTIGRFGGDEFIIILEDLKNPNQAAEVSARLISSLSIPIRIEDREFFVGASIGITVYPNDAKDSTALLSNADLAMYRAKDIGGNRYQFFTNSMNEIARKRMELERDLRLAIENEELEIYYQPIVDITTGRISAVEALLRWNHPRMGLLRPHQFITLAEETGMIGSIGHWVLENACKQTNVWNHKSGMPVTISVNLSASQIHLGLNGDMLNRILERTGLSPGHLTLEITESMMMDDNESTARWFRELKETGVSLSVDDFGTGYSALSYLKKYPMDTLKIDRSFIMDLVSENSDVSLVQAIMAMAENLGMRVIAEGVETEIQLAILQSLNCRYFQGFYFSEPVPAKELEILKERTF